MSTRDTATQPSSTDASSAASARYTWRVARGSIFDPTDDQNTVQKTIRDPWETARAGLKSSIEALANLTGGINTDSTIKTHLASLKSLSKAMEEHMVDKTSLISMTPNYKAETASDARQRVKAAFSYNLAKLESGCKSLQQDCLPYMASTVETSLMAPARALGSEGALLSPSTGSLSMVSTPSDIQQKGIERLKDTVLKTLNAVDQTYSGFAYEVEKVEKHLELDKTKFSVQG